MSPSPGPLRNPGAGAGPGELYAYEVRRTGRVVAQLRAVGQGDGGVVVEATVFPGGRGEGIARPFAFTSADSARRFVDEALVSLEYLNCEVVV